MTDYSSTWFARNGGDPEIPQPTFKGFNRYEAGMTVAHYAEAAATLRTAFAFFRRHSDRRYSAVSLMKLLSYADYLERVVGGDDEFRSEDAPSILVAEIPFSYDEETEVKTGGMLGVAVLLPDNRLMLCVHVDKRRVKLGKSLMSGVTGFFACYPQVWVHRNNLTGAQFVLACGLSPWAINPSGAVQYSMREPVEDDTGATDDGGDVGFLLEQAAVRRHRGLTEDFFGSFLDEDARR